jgi:hypothetical protein
VEIQTTVHYRSAAEWNAFDHWTTLCQVQMHSANEL